MKICNLPKDSNGKCSHLWGSNCNYKCCMECPETNCNSRCRFSIKKIRKGVNKLEFFETKVIKVKKERTLQVNPRGAGKSTKYWECLSDEVLQRLEFNSRRELERRKTVEPKCKGNFVNGENLDKIKFPCFCSYKQPLTDLNEHLGIIEYIAIYGEKARYVLINIEGQRKNCKLIPIFEDLKSLIQSYEIKILKGKIIIFKEEQ